MRYWTYESWQKRRIKNYLTREQQSYSHRKLIGLKASVTFHWIFLTMTEAMFEPIGPFDIHSFASIILGVFQLLSMLSVEVKRQQNA